MAEVANGTPSPVLTDTPEAQETTIGMEKDMRKDPHSQGSSIATLGPYTQTVKKSLGHQGVNHAGGLDAYQRVLFCTNLDTAVDYEILYEDMKDYGNIERIRLTLDATGKTFDVYVTFSNSSDALKAFRDIRKNPKVKCKLMNVKSIHNGVPDFIPSKLGLVKEDVKPKEPHFCNIFRTSLEQRKAVRDWKLQNISPLFKKGSKDGPGNYRPISLTSVPGKMLESIIADDMMSHLEHNKLILDSQHGFRSGRSCLTNLVDFFHDMFSIYDKSRAVDILYLDFRKAFDKVPHKRLMAKVRSLGVIDKVGDWIEDWLSDRKQRVVINGTSSGWREVTSGVPQGSVLGPLLFIIYINDLDLGLVSKISKFADDTKMGIDADSDAAVKQLQEDLRKVGEWSKKWQMPFNLDKCKIMHIGHKNKNEKYELLCKEIESVQQEKDLGVVITNDLKSSN